MSETATATEKQQTSSSAPNGNGRRTMDVVHKGLKKRYAAERRFRIYGLSAIMLALLFLTILFVSIISNGYSAFWQTFIRLEVYLDPAKIDLDDPIGSNYQGVVKQAMRELFPDVTERSEKRQLYKLISSGAGFRVRDLVTESPDMLGKTESLWLPADDEVDLMVKGVLSSDTMIRDGRLSENQVQWIQSLESRGDVATRFNTIFFSAGDSREPELAGIRGAVYGSFFTLIVTLALSFPIGVATAIYLEEFASTNKFTDFLEVNINNLAAVPSIVFGLLGLAVFLNFFGLPRSAPVVGGLVLTLMTLPTVIIASRASLRSVPPSIREGALGIGASQMQMVLHHVLPLAMPGILTGTIIGMAQALGETAPLLMIGMVAFIVDPPTGFTDPATVLPVQVYLWADSPERAFVAKTSAAIMVLLAFLILMNATAVILRKRFERRW
jgi:phosphate transport system permease protein